VAKIRRLQYQLDAVKQIEQFNGRVLLADEMGLGKSIEVLLWLWKHPELKPVIVVCPASLKWVWENFIHQILNIRCDVLQGTAPPKNRLFRKHSFIVINYEILQYWLPFLKKLNIKVLIIDECHYQKSIRAKRTKAIWELSKNIPHIIAMSGTPLTNRPSELWTTLRLIRPDLYKSFFSYAFHFCNPIRRPWGWDYKGAANLTELHRQLKSTMMIRRLKKNVLTELPDKTRTIIPLDIEKREDYNKAVHNFIAWLSKQSITKAKKAKKAEQLVKMGYLKRLAAELKMKAVFSWIDNCIEYNDGKLVVYCTHRKIVQMLANKYKGICVVIDGSTSPKKRKLAVRAFQTNKQKRIFIGNIKAAGVGITLTAASILAFIELDWVPGNHTQAEDRIHRIGQKDAASIYYLIAKDTIEEYLCQLIQKKQEILTSTLDGKNKTNQLNIFDELEKALRKGK